MKARAISDSPDWFNKDIPDDNREAAIELDFERLMSGNKKYQQADDVTKEDFRLAHRQLVEEAALNSKYNPLNQQRVIDQDAADKNGFVTNLLKTGKRSLEDTASRTMMLDDLVGRPDDNYATQVAKYLQKQSAAPMTQERKKLAQEMKLWDERTDKSGIVGDVMATAKLIANNPGGLLDVAAESIGSMASMAAGAEAGSAVAAGVTAATGGWAAPAAPFITGAGMFTAEAADAASAKMVEKIQLALDKQGIAYTPANIQAYLDNNPEAITGIQKDSAKYGGVLAAIDVAMGGFFSKLASLPTKAARKTAMRSMDDAARAMLAAKAADIGVSVEKVTEDFINHGAKQILDARSFKSKLGSKILSYAGEVAGEPLSEAGASASIGDVSAVDLMYETLGGIGAGPIGASINTAAFGTKVAKDKTKAFAEQILTSTPETREAIQQLKTETQTAKIQKDARNEAGFKKDIESVTADDPRIDEWADASNTEKYNPAKAVAALSKLTDNKEAVNKAEAVYFETHKSALEVNERLTALTEKGEENLTAQERLQYKELTKQMDAKVALLNQIRPQILTMREKRKAASIEVETATPEQVTSHVTETYGSSQASLNIQQLDTLLSRNDLPDTQRTLIQAMKEAEEARQTIVTSSSPTTSRKSLEQVREDVYSGTKEYKGIDAFKTAIANFLHPTVNKQDQALKELEGLKAFRDSHQSKLTKLSEAFEEVSKVAYDPQTQSRPEVKVVVGGRTYTIHKNSGRLIEAVSNETIALQKEVIAAETLINARIDPGPVTQAASTKESSIEPVAAEVPSVPVTTKQPGTSAPNKVITENKVSTVSVKASAENKQVTKKTLLDGLVDKKQATKRHNGYFIHAGAEWASGNGNMAGTTADGAVYVDMGISDRFFNGDPATVAEVQNKKSLMFSAMGIDVDQFRSLFSNKQELNEFLLKHEKSHVTNNDKDNYPRNKEGNYDTASDKAVAIELRATMDALSAEQKSKLHALVEGNKKTFKEAPVEEGSTNTSTETAGKKESTPVSIADSVASESNSESGTETQDPGDVEVTYTDLRGKEVTHSYREAMIDLSTQLQETRQILRCLRS